MCPSIPENGRSGSHDPASVYLPGVAQILCSSRICIFLVYGLIIFHRFARQACGSRLGYLTADLSGLDSVDAGAIEAGAVSLRGARLVAGVCHRGRCAQESHFDQDVALAGRISLPSCRQGRCQQPGLYRPCDESWRTFRGTHPERCRP